MKLRAYLDNNATTRLAPEALAAMTPYLTEVFLNPSSAAGELLGASRPIADARLALARLLGADGLEGRFLLTSGASEANSWALHAAVTDRPPGRLVSTAIEHPSLLAALEARRRAGWTVDLAGPDPEGVVRPDALAPLLRGDTALVSVMLANNETGVVQPLAALAEVVRTHTAGALLHVDATQAVGRLPVDLLGELREVDLLSLTAHKLHGPKGIGALFVRDGLEVTALIHGSQQDGRRGGTPDPAAAAGLAAAVDLARAGLSRMDDIERLRNLFERDLAARCPDLQVLGGSASRLPNTSAFTLPGLDADRAVEALALRGVVVASGSACTSGAPGPSHVLTAMGTPYAAARSTLRVSLSRETTRQEVDLAVCAIAELQHVAA